MAEQIDDIEVLGAARDWLVAGQRVALATVIRTWGSSPRPPGSLLVMNGEGQFVGSVSGGCVEETLVADFALVEGLFERLGVARCIASERPATRSGPGSSSVSLTPFLRIHFYSSPSVSPSPSRIPYSCGVG